MWIYAFNDAAAAEPHIDTAYPRRQPLPEDFPDEAVLTMLERAFPEKNGDELLRLEDLIRHNSAVQLCSCTEKESAEMLRKFQPVPENLRLEAVKSCLNPEPEPLPSLCGGQWRICEGCPHFSLKDRTGRCEKRWCCRWGASNPHEWNVDRDPMWYHPQCVRIVRHFRFEAAFICYTERFRDEVLAGKDSGHLLAEREHLLCRDLMAAAEKGDALRIGKRCTELGESFAEFASRHDIFNRMLNFWEVNQKLIDRVRLLQDEGIAIPEKWRSELLRLSGPSGLCAELHRLLKKTEKK